MSHSAAIRCFQNSLILQKIFENCDDLMDNSQFRLVDRKFNDNYRRATRRDLAITVFVDDRCLPEVSVNNQYVDTNQLKSCFESLLKSDGVKLYKLKVIRGDGSSRYWSNRQLQEIHDIIIDSIENQRLKVFTGMDALCEGCERCIRHSIQSKVYGPIHCDFLEIRFDIPKHFEKLIVNDQMLWLIPGLCALFFPNSLDENLAALNRYISMAVTCDQLQFEVYDHPFDRESYMKIPREVMEQMCMTWKPKSIRLTISSLNNKIPSIFWTTFNNTQFFTEFCFYDSHENTAQSKGFHLESVEVDLEEAPFSCNGVFGDKNVDHCPSNDNLIANVRKVFPANQYLFNSHKMSKYTTFDGCNDYEINSNRLKTMIDAVFLGQSSSSDQSTNQSITLRYWTKISKKAVEFDIPERFSYENDPENRMFTCTVTPGIIRDNFDCWDSPIPSIRKRRSIDRIAKSFKIREKTSGIEINLEIYVDKEHLDKMDSKGFLRHYHC